VLGYITAWRANLVCCEQVAFQELAIRQLSQAGAPLIPVRTSRGKEERFDVIHTLYAQGEIWWSESLSTEFTNELYSFPFGHDDQMDSHCFAIAGLYKWIRDAWCEPGSLGRATGRFDNTLEHERKAAELRHSDGSYAKYVVRDAADEPELIEYNADGTEKVDDGRRIEKVGDDAVLLDRDGKELARCSWAAHVWTLCGQATSRSCISELVP